MATLTTGEHAAIGVGRDTLRPSRTRAAFAFAARWWHLLALTAITAAGAGLRFFSMDRPTLWGDEAATFSRVNGDYYEMLEYLQYDGFPPIHYQLYWLLGQVTYLDPWMMRLIPATAGVLMIPAVYFAARQVMFRRAALVAALLTMGSAWMLAHSRDAKMYMLTWLLVTMAMGCLFCWLRTDRKLAWLGWIFFGLASVGTHASAMIMLAFMPVFVLLSPRLFTLRLPRLADRRAAWALQLGPPVALTGIGLLAATLAGVWDLTEGRQTWIDIALLGGGGLAVLTLVCCPWLTNWRLHLMALGFAAIGTGPALYYYFFNKWIARTGGIFSGITVSESAVDGALVMAAAFVMCLLLFPLMSGPRGRLAVIAGALAAAVVVKWRLVVEGLVPAGTGGAAILDGVLVVAAASILVRLAWPSLRTSRLRWGTAVSAVALGVLGSWAMYATTRDITQYAGDRSALLSHNDAAALAAGDLAADGDGQAAEAGSEGGADAGEFNDGRDGFTGWNASGLTWLRVGSGPRTLRQSTSVYLTGWRYPDERRLNRKVRGGGYAIPRVVVYSATTVMSVTALACALALLPWARRVAPKPGGDGAAGFATELPGRAAVPGYRGGACVLAWLVLPTYGFFYCRSIEDFVPPWHWLEVAWTKAEAVWLGLLGVTPIAESAKWGERLSQGPAGIPWWVPVVGAIAVTVLVLMRWWATRLIVQTTIGLTLLWPMKHALSEGGWDWLGLYVEALLAPWPFGILSVVVPAAAIHHCGGGWRERGVRSARWLYAVVAVLAFCAVLWLFWFVMREVADNRGMLAWLDGETQSRKAYAWRPLWTPRYLGIVWPALALAFAWLVMRLPGWPTRLLVVAVFLTVNLGLGGARITLDTEPRLDLIAADIWAANDDYETVGVYFFNGHGGRNWRNPARLSHWTGSYYLVNHKQIRPSPHEVRGSWIYGGNRRDINQVPKRLDHQPPAIHFRQLPDHLKGRPGLERLVVWTFYRAGPKPDTSGNTALQDTLGPQWRQVDDVFHEQWRYREWNQGNWTRRRVFERVEAEPAVQTAPPSSDASGA